MKKINRRELMKLGVVASGTLLVAGKLVPLAEAADCDDSKITSQGYVSDASKIDAKNKDFARFEATTKSVADLATKEKKSTAGLISHCANCKLYKEKSAGCGTCAMVGATGAPGKLVKSTGWCKVYMADATKLK